VGYRVVSGAWDGTRYAHPHVAGTINQATADERPPI
jgi:hypothetical protein